jgi:anti-anti-sigma factor
MKVSGRLDAANAAEFDKQCLTVINTGIKTLIVDLSGVAYVSSLGLRSFVSAGKEMQSRDGKLILVGLKGMVKEVFTITQFISLFPVFDTVDAALQNA